jgi:hypothetical protein
MNIQKGTQTIQGIEVTPKVWNDRIYFNSNRGNACWDTKTEEWVKCRQEVGSRFKGFIRQVFEF